MSSLFRGEVELTVNEQTHIMRLTLGSLAELEETLKSESLMKMIERFEDGEFRTHDIIALLVAGLKGGGWQGTQEDLMSAEIEGGAIHAAKQAGLLLRSAFSLPE